ncbi:MAG: Crp/Fnr family transcriptional regulator [Ramlibacter sp.]
MRTSPPGIREPADLHAVDADRNRLLALMPRETRRAWTPLCELVSLPLGEALFDPGDTLRFVYFPVTATVALLHLLGTGDCVQVAMVGREGLVGTGAFMGGGPMTMRAVVQNAGTALRIDAAAVKEEFEHGGQTMRLLLQYAQALMFQVSQTAVCNRHHTPQQQLCRWLMLSLDRAHGDEIVTTHELVGMMLGVRRETVSDAIGRLQAQGLVRSGRGRIKVLDRPGLELGACECYRMVRHEYEMLLAARPDAGS